MIIMRIAFQYGSNDSRWAGARSELICFDRLGIISSMCFTARICQGGGEK